MALTENIAEYKLPGGGDICLIIYRDMEQNTLLLDWHWKYEYGFDIAQECCLGVIDKVKESGCNQLISDFSKIEGSWDSINDWVIGTWLPSAKEAGVNSIAFIHPEEFFANLASELLTEGLEMAGLMTYNVSNLDDAGKCLNLK